jgi:geranylgeranylglycerol-phosphate geranylgeranyltransferase
MVRLLPWAKLLRPANGLISLAGTVIAGLSVLGILSAGHLYSFVLALVLAGITTFLATSAGNALNDYVDAEGDKINHPDRPIPKGEVTRKGVLAYSVVLYALSPVPLALLLPLGLFPGTVGFASLEALILIWAASVCLMVGYEFNWKQQGLTGNAIVALLTGLVFLFGATVVWHPVNALPLMAMAFLATLSREVIKDMEDVAGDSARTTLPKTYGMTTAAQVGRLSAVLAIVLSPLPLLLWLPFFSPAGMAYLAIVIASDAVFVLSVAWLPQKLHREQGLSKIAMVLALGAFLGASLR